MRELGTAVLALPDPGIESGSPALQADSLPSETPGKSNPDGKILISKIVL